MTEAMRYVVFIFLATILVMSPDTVAGDDSGVFRVEKRDGKWRLIDPQGEPFYLRGLNHYGDGSGMPWVLNDRYGSKQKWRESVRDRAKEWGFNYLPPSIGPTAIDPKSPAAKDHPRLVTRTKEWPASHYAELEFPFTIFLEHPKQYMAGPGMPDVFSDKFAAEVDARCKEICDPLNDSPYLVGYYFCHNPPWHPSAKSFDQWIDDATAGMMQMGVEHPQIIGFGWCGFYETPDPGGRSGIVDVKTGDPLPERLEIIQRWNRWMADRERVTE